jgi:hypothetical protein
MQGIDIRPRGSCPRANGGGDAYRDEDAHFARRQAFGLDDIDSPTHYVEHAAKTLFLVWVTLTEHKWVTLGERRRSGGWRMLANDLSGVILRLRGETTSGCRPTHAPPIARNRGRRRADEIARGAADAGPAPTRGPAFPGEIGDARHVLGCHERQTASGDGRMTTRSLWIAAGCAAVLASTQDRALW